MDVEISGLVEVHPGFPGKEMRPSKGIECEQKHLRATLDKGSNLVGALSLAFLILI